jgi:hypothetical protein
MMWDANRSRPGKERASIVSAADSIIRSRGRRAGVAGVSPAVFPLLHKIAKTPAGRQRRENQWNLLKNGMRLWV